MGSNIFIESNSTIHTTSDILHVVNKIHNELKKSWSEMNISEKLIYVITLGLYSSHLEPQQIEALRGHLASFEPIKNPQTPNLIGRLNLINHCVIECYREDPCKDNAWEPSLTLCVKEPIEQSGHYSALLDQQLQITSEYKLNKEQCDTLIGLMPSKAFNFGFDVIHYTQKKDSLWKTDLTSIEGEKILEEGNLFSALDIQSFKSMANACAKNTSKLISDTVDRKTLSTFDSLAADVSRNFIDDRQKLYINNLEVNNDAIEYIFNERLRKNVSTETFLNNIRPLTKEQAIDLYRQSTTHNTDEENREDAFITVFATERGFAGFLSLSAQSLAATTEMATLNYNIILGEAGINMNVGNTPRLERTHLTVSPSIVDDIPATITAKKEYFFLAHAPHFSTSNENTHRTLNNSDLNKSGVAMVRAEYDVPDSLTLSEASMENLLHPRRSTAYVYPGIAD